MDRVLDPARHMLMRRRRALISAVLVAVSLAGCDSEGSRAVGVLDASGPMGTAGDLYAAWSIPALLHATGKAGALACARGCWKDVSPPPGDLLVGMRLSPSDCFQIDDGAATEATPGWVAIVLTATPTCTRGGGAARQAGLTLIAVPVSAATRAAHEITVSVIAKLPVKTVDVGQVTVSHT